MLSIFINYSFFSSPFSAVLLSLSSFITNHFRPLYRFNHFFSLIVSICPNHLNTMRPTLFTQLTSARLPIILMPDMFLRHVISDTSSFLSSRTRNIYFSEPYTTWVSPLFHTSLLCSPSTTFPASLLFSFFRVTYESSPVRTYHHP